MGERHTSRRGSVKHTYTEAEVEPIIAAAQALGAKEYTSYVDAGLLCRRFLTSDGSIDLTVRVK